ncbi:hypothetical protein A2U01_0067806, partial [Trifolium medium]|nr:hypothetical protein [Trifolium medium]
DTAAQGQVSAAQRQMATAIDKTSAVLINFGKVILVGWQQKMGIVIAEKWLRSMLQISLNIYQLQS